MSQVSYKTEVDGQSVEIVGGWDHPVKNFFLTIFNLDAPDDEEDVIYCQLDHFPIGEPLTTDPLKKDLALHGYSVPPKFWELVELKEGNAFHKVER